MKKHLTEILRRHDAYVMRMMRCQIRSRESMHYGGFMTGGHHVEPRVAGFTLARLVTSYVCRESALYKDEALRGAIDANMEYLIAHQRESGCVDLSNVNFDSAPDTAFMVNHLLNGYWLMEKRGWDAIKPLKEQLLAYIVRCSEGVAAGGFHTPNHRWGIAACLMSVWKITGRADFKQRAEEYLSEGIDINEDGEFAERSAGNYNQVTDDQLLRLYLATDDRQYLEYIRRNLEMMYCYIEPDASVFTGNSTRQDKGTKVYLESYYPFFLLTGYFLRDEKLGAIAEWIYSVAGENVTSEGDGETAAWLLLFEDADGFGSDAPLETPWTHYDRYFRESGIARMRRGDLSLTLMERKPNFLYFQHGSATMYMVIHSRVCSKGHFEPESIEPIEGGYRLRARLESRYAMPFYPEKPESSDWWKMDNSRRRQILLEPLVYTVDVTNTQDGCEVRIHTDGLDGVPVRVEIGFEAGTQLRTPSMIMEGKGGDVVTLLSGDAQLTGPRGEVITLRGAFGQHSDLRRRNNAYPLSPAHFTLCMTAYTPMDRVIRIGTQPLYADYLC